MPGRVDGPIGHALHSGTLQSQINEVMSP
jgi:hypothetical protein